MAYFVDEENKEVEQLTPEEEVIVSEAESNLQTVKPVSKAKKQKSKGTNKVKSTISELKKVTWPTFGKVVKQTIVVLSVTFVFLLVVIGIDQLLYLLYNLLTKNM